MNDELKKEYASIRAGATGFYEQKRGLIAVHGAEAIQFLNGLVTNDVAGLEDGAQMLAAFPNAQGRLLAVVRVLRTEDRFLFETEEATHEKVFNNLFRFTFAGDFFVEDLSANYRYFSIFDRSYLPMTQPLIEFDSPAGSDYFVQTDDAEDLLTELRNIDAVQVSDEVYDLLRIESGIPKYGVDMDETTIVPELGLEGLISYTKGCYIGQEIIARIHFRGHVAKRLTGLVFDQEPQPSEDRTLTDAAGKNAGRVTSLIFSPALKKFIALAYVRYEFLADGTQLSASGTAAAVKDLPFI